MNELQEAQKAKENARWYIQFGYNEDMEEANRRYKLKCAKLLAAKNFYKQTLKEKYPTFTPVYLLM